ncbi:MAG TPA: hypothetical protein VND65_12150 [Candidatus Binatia bacterium]|nr:hypothetical protein [Candidatus Binatia bacterium]
MSLSWGGHVVRPKFFLLLPLLGLISSFALAQQAANSAFDGPAELPRERVASSMKDTPAQGKTILVKPGENIAAALGRASCGDTVELQAGATFSGNVEIPARNCDDAHWIIIRTSAPDASLPAEGKRLTPCYAGVSSLPGRPPLRCTATNNVLAKLEFNGKGGNGPIIFAAGANHYRLVGLEVTRVASPATLHAMIQFAGRADHIVFDRMWIHGSPQDETARGVSLGASRYVAVVDSYINDLHCVAKSGACTESTAVGGGLGEDPMGPYKIANNFLEAAGENVYFGGGHATLSPQDIEVVHNHMFKPFTWMKGQPGFVGGSDGNPFIVKNLFELKNAQRVLLEGNVMQGSWGGFSQRGFAILLTPKNQGSAKASVCPACQVTDVTVRYNAIHRVGAGLQIANGLSDAGGAAADGQRYSIHDLVIDGIDGRTFDGLGEFAQLSMGNGAALLQNVSINHVTAFPDRMLFVGAPSGTRMKNFVFTSNILNAGKYPVWSTGGGPSNCAFSNSPQTTLENCFSSYTFGANVILDSPPASWPPRNFFGSEKSVKFVNFNDGNGGDYHLQPSSPYRGKGLDGKDVGADIDAVNAATAGVE